MVIYYKHLSEPWFTYLREGRKTVEGRLATGDWAQMKTGDEIIFWYNQNYPDLRDYQNSHGLQGHSEINCIIIETEWFNTFAELYLHYGRWLLPHVYSMEEAERIYIKNALTGTGIYSKEDETKYGVVGIDIDVKKITIT